MSAPHIHDLLAALEPAVEIDPDVDARIRSAVSAELRRSEPRLPTHPPAVRAIATPDIDVDPSHQSREPRRRSRTLALIAAALVAIAVFGATLALVVRDDGEQAPTDTTPLPTVPTVETVPTPTTTPTTTATTPPITEPIELSSTTYGGTALDATPIPIEGRNPYRVAVARDVWTMSLDGHVERRDPTTLDITAELTVADSSLIAADDDALWVADAVTGRVMRIDPDTTEVVADIPTGITVDQPVFRSGGLGMYAGTQRQFARIGSIEASLGSVWVGDQDGRVLRIDPERNWVAETFDVDMRADLVRADGDHIVVASRETGRVAVIDAATGDEVFSTEVDGQLVGADLHGGAVYVHDPDSGVVTRTDLSSKTELRSAPLGPLANTYGNPLYSPILTVGDAGVLVTSTSGLHVLDTATLQEVARFDDVDTRAGEMLIAPAGTAWIVQFYGSTISRLAPLPR